MTRYLPSFIHALYLVVASLLLPVSLPAQKDPGVSFFDYGAFGTVTVYAPSRTPGSVVLFLSGDGGWQNHVLEMARALRDAGAIVAGISLPRYLKNVKNGKCFYPAGDFEELSKQVQQRAHLPAYQVPVLAGYSSGATMVYAMLAQAPVGTFAGGISLGFCPDLEGTKEPCKGNGLHCFAITKPAAGWMLEPDEGLAVPWYLLQGEADKCCDFATARTFAGKIPAAHLFAIPSTGHGFAVDKNWMPRFKEAFLKIVSTQNAAPPNTGNQGEAHGSQRGERALSQASGVYHGLSFSSRVMSAANEAASCSWRTASRRRPVGSKT